MGLLGWSLVLASVLYIAIRRPPFLVETLNSLCGGAQKIQQTRPAGDVVPGGRSSSSAAPVQNKEDNVQSRKKHLEEAPNPDEDPEAQTTPKATASTTTTNGTIPSFSLSTDPDPPPSAAATARVADAVQPNAAPVLAPPMPPLPPQITAPSPSMAMPPPRLPALSNPDGTSSGASLAAPSRSAQLLNRSRQAQYTRQPGTSTLAPPPTHSAKPTAPSRKVTLEPGHSPLDWARLANHPTADLRGLGPGAPYLRVTPSMLKQQTGRRGKDAWTALGGRVYNITPYLPFHPGGEPELLRAAGRDGTKIFGEIHPWVNYETMLSSCMVGLLVNETEAQGTGDMDAMD
ncbi:hypothetical protein GGS20DRAFT_509644 [Poronia punctata]|nr:hypothetical protein GGS20DRAFT_509644 [Poronia punctata]